MNTIIIIFITIAVLAWSIAITRKRYERPVTKVGAFRKVTYEQFKSDYEDYVKSLEGQLPSNTNLIYGEIQLPARATKHSAGYDFYSPVAFILHPGESIKFPTGVCVDIDKGWMLKIYPRSSIGFKYQTVLANTVGIIDSDYYYSDHGGHIWIKLVNNGNKDLIVKRGDRIVQGIFEPYGITYDDNVTAKRSGGFGSSGR